jgi:hypothetical protein
VKHLLAVALLALPGHAFAASPIVPPAPGARIRVTLLERTATPIVGTLLALPPGTIEYEDSLAHSVPRTSVAKLELSRGMKAKTVQYALVGGILTGVAVGTFGYIVGSSTDDDAAPATLGGGLGAAGFLVGMGFGAIIGSGTKAEKWERVELP